ncbi:hypothetical protein Ancab_005257, partial [Ancistrocladus abbreviatus]
FDGLPPWVIPSGECTTVLVWKGYGDQCHKGLHALDPPQTSPQRRSWFTQRKARKNFCRNLLSGWKKSFMWDDLSLAAVVVWGWAFFSEGFI